MKGHRWVSWLGVAVVAVGALAIGARTEGPSNDPKSRAEHIAAELRCPVCQGLSVLDSDSSTARSIRGDIARRIRAGQSDAEIRQAYVDRYGEWVLLRPRGGGIGTVVWLLPVVALVGGSVGLGVALLGWRRRLAEQATPEDRLVVARALSRSEADPP